MSFTNPAAWIWAGLALPIIALYILKIRQRRVPVSTTLFWEQVFEERKPRAWWRRLRHLTSLLLQLAFLALLVGALADPVLEWDVLKARRVVLVIDNSASMKAEDGGGGRFQRAVERAGQLIGDLRSRDSMAVIAGGTTPTVHCGMTNHQRTLREALADVESGDGPTRVVEAVALARRILAGDDRAEIVVLSDGGFEGAVDLAAQDDVTFLQVGETVDNVGITQFQVRRSLADPVGYEILADVTNFSDEAIECRFDFELSGEILDVVPVKLAPGERWRRVFEKTSAAGGRLIGRLNVEDALAVDDVAVALLPEREAIHVVLAGEPNLFLHTVLESNPLVRLSVAEDLAKLPAGDVLVCHQRFPASLPAMPVLIIDPTESHALFEVGEPIAAPLVTEQDRGSPLMRFVDLENVFIPEARVMSAKGPAHRLAASLSEDPIYLQFERPEGAVLVLGVNLTATDLPLRTAFPILVANAMNWFSGSKGELRESLSSGAVTKVALHELDLGAIAERQGIEVAASTAPGAIARVGLGPELSLASPGGGSSRLRVRGATATVGPLDRCGLWVIHEGSDAAAGDEESIDPESLDADAVILAVNLADGRESDLRVPDELGGDDPPATAGFGGKPIWFYLVAIALFLSTIEWAMYHRRRVE